MRMIRLLCLSFLACTLCIAWAIALAQNEPTVEQFQREWQRMKSVSFEQTIAESKDLSDAERADLLGAIASRLRSPNSELDSEAERNSKDEAAQFRVKTIDLSENGKGKVFLVQGAGAHSCSPTGNCDFWVFRGGIRGYSVILHGIGQTFAIQPTTANGFHDVVLAMHGSATMTALKLYRFNSAMYRRVGCYNESWQYVDEDGKAHQPEKPRITLCGQ